MVLAIGLKADHMINNFRLTNKGLILVSIPLIFQIIFIAILSYSVERAEDAARKAEISRSIVYEIEAIDKLFYEAGLSLVIYKLTNVQDRLKRYDELCYQIAKGSSAVGNLIKNQPGQKHSFEQLQASVDDGLKIFHNAKEGIDSGQMSEEEVLKQTILLSNRLQSTLDKIFLYEQKQGALEPERENQIKEFIKDLLLGGVICNIILAMWLAVMFNQATGRRLNVVLENLRRFGKGDPLLPPITGSDEITTLDTAFRHMARALDDARHKEKAIIENANDVICSLSSNFLLRAINYAVVKNWGYLPEEVTGTNILDFVTENAKEALSKNLKEVIDTKTAGRFESKILHKSGKVIDVLLSVSWSQAEESLFCVVHDNSERKESERIKQEIMKMVSHDLRSPLTSIQFSLDALGSGSRGRINEEGLKDIAIAKKNVNQLMKLINYLLDIEKLASGSLKLNLEQISVDFLVNRAIESIESWAADRNIEINYNHSGLFIVADSELLAQVLINLLANAIKFSPENSKIDVLAEIEDFMLMIKVVDYGPGIPKKQLAEIFKPFKQLDRPVSQKTPGTGLGLSICKMIVEMHKGIIGVISEEEKGSTFWFGIPLKGFFDLK